MKPFQISAVAVILLFTAVCVYRYKFGIILNIPALMGQPERVVEKTCGVPEKVEKHGPRGETRWYTQPLPVTINYDAGKAVSMHIGPRAMYKAGLRFSKAKQWMRRFGFSHLPSPVEKSPLILEWRDWRGLSSITVEYATSGDAGIDIGGDSDDVALSVTKGYYRQPGAVHYGE